MNFKKIKKICGHDPRLSVKSEVEVLKISLSGGFVPPPGRKTGNFAFFSTMPGDVIGIVPAKQSL